MTTGTEFLAGAAINGIIGTAAEMTFNKISEFISKFKSEDEPILYINEVSVVRKIIKGMPYKKILDLNTDLDIESAIDENFIILKLENMGKDIIKNIECKTLVVHVGDYEEYRDTGDGRFYKSKQQTAASVRILHGKSEAIYLLAKDEDGETIADYLNNAEFATLYLELKVGTKEVYLSCYLEKNEDGTYIIHEQA